MRESNDAPAPALRRPYQPPRLEVCEVASPRAQDKNVDANTNCSDHLHDADGFGPC